MNFQNLKVVVIGDFMIDHYVMGDSFRMSPEAPVPVVLPKKEYSCPGGAGNVAMNLSSLGAEVHCIGVVGDDFFGLELMKILENEGIYTKHIKKIKNHITTLKQRIYSNGEQVARIDKEKIKDFKLNFKKMNLEKYDACIISDYNKGVIKSIDINTKLLIVDPKKEDFSKYKGANIITPNLAELQKASTLPISDEKSIVLACSNLIKKNGFDFIVAKRGENGVTVVGRDKFFKHISTKAVSNADVTGAGDTVIAVLSLVYAKTNDILLSAKIANAAAGTVVSKKGTNIVKISEINF
tara:strand:+ start:2122 stop:3009 length:888 start_codon:yes stop_codon:yes gene_type:complete